MTSARKPTAGFWMTVALVAVVVGYPLSFGPACWINERTGRGYADGIGYRFIRSFYSPVLAYAGQHRTGSDFVDWYARCGTTNRVAMTIGFSRDEMGQMHDIEFLWERGY
jgi:hypothetical protein